MSKIPNEETKKITDKTVQSWRAGDKQIKKPLGEGLTLARNHSE
jgi:hypothetical protein